MRAKHPSKEKTAGSSHEKPAAVILALISFCIIARGVDGPGIAWDEAVYIPAAVNYIAWFEEISGGFREGEPLRGFSAEAIHHHWKLNWEHPPLAKYAAAASMRLLSGLTGAIPAARMSSAGLIASSVLLCSVMAGKIYGGRSGMFAGVFLLLMPRIFGHARLVSLDVSVTFAWLLSAYFFLKIGERKNFILPAGIALGLALLAKFNAVLIPFTFLAWAVLYRRKKEAKAILPVLIIAAAAVLLLWPWLWHFTFAKILGYARFHFTRGYLVPVLFLGRVYDSSPAPFYYPLLLAVFTLPPAGLAFLTYKLFLSFKNRPPGHEDGFIIMNAAAPVLAAAVPFIGKYDGIRLFLPAFPFIAILAGAGLDKALGKLGERTCRKACLPAAAAIMAASSLPLFSLSPFHLSYYNVFCGGLRGARALGMETTYWGETMDSGVLEHLNAGAPENAKVVFYPAGSMVVKLLKATGRLRDDIIETPVERLREACYLVLIHRQGMWTDDIRETARELEPEFSNGFAGVRFTGVYRFK